jgi:carboxymethylenebutenolidase
MRRCLLALLFLVGATPLHAQPYAQARLDSSPRHLEWTTLAAGEGRTLHAFVAWPERHADALAVIVIHENRGLTDWVRSFADQLAEAGFIAIAPDLLSGFDPEHARTKDFASEDAAREAISRLDPEQVTHDLHALMAWAAKLPGGDGRVAVMGFCWGGAQTFRFATNARDLAGAFVFYGTAPTDESALARIATPVHGFYGADDQRVNATIEATRTAMLDLERPYEPVVYDGAGHGFMRAGDDPAAAPELRAARDAAFIRLTSLLANPK